MSVALPNAVRSLVAGRADELKIEVRRRLVSAGELIDGDRPVLVRTWHPNYDDCWVLHYQADGRDQTYLTWGEEADALEDAAAWYSMQ